MAAYPAQLSQQDCVVTRGILQQYTSQTWTRTPGYATPAGWMQCVFSVDPKLACKKGGIVLLFHNDVAAEWHSMCAAPFTPSIVFKEPLIHISWAAARADGQPNTPTDSTTAAPSNGVAANDAEKSKDSALSSNVSVHGFWKWVTPTIFDMHVVDTYAKFYLKNTLKRQYQMQSGRRN